MNTFNVRFISQAAIWNNALINAIVDCPPDGILENIKCSCKKGCAGNRCACVKANLFCTSFCKCIDCVSGKENSDKSSDSDDDSEGEEDSDNE